VEFLPGVSDRTLVAQKGQTEMSLKRGAFAGDLGKYYKIDFGDTRPRHWRKLSLWANSFGLHCVAAYRFGQFASRLYHKSIFVGLIPRALHACMNYFIRMVYHVEVNAISIGPGFYIGHVGPIYIGATNIGSNFSVTHNVTVGFGHSMGKEGRPTIGDNVWIGTGSTVAGAISIGNNVTIMPGTFLSRTVPDGCLVGGNPGRVLAQNYDNLKLFS
jgi:serine O-acetyltransferase